MKKCIAVLTSFIVALVFLMGTTPGFCSEKNPYKLGIVLDLTGRAASLGIPQKRVYQMLTKEINEQGGINGRPLELKIYDAESRPSKAVVNTKSLINVDDAIACLGYTSSGTTMASIPAATTGKTVLFSTASSEKIWNPTKDWVFNTTPSQEYASTPFLVDNLVDRGSSKIAFVYIDTKYGQTGKETFERVVKNNDKVESALIEDYAPGSTDLNPQVTHVRKSGADGLIICGYVGDSAKMLKTARDQGVDFPINCEYAIVSPEFIDLAGDYGEGVVTTSLKTLVAPDLPDSDVQKDVCMELYEKYTNKYGEFSLYAGHAWDAMNITLKALRQIDPSLDPGNETELKKIRTRLRDNIEQIDRYVGQNGVYDYSPDNHNGLSPGCYVLVTVKDGKWRLYEKVKQDL